MLSHPLLSFHTFLCSSSSSEAPPGASKVTQCPIQPQTSFTYEFVAEPAGTHGYHAHHGLERSDGLFGALIVHEKKTPNLHSELCDTDKYDSVVSGHERVFNLHVIHSAFESPII